MLRGYPVTSTNQAEPNQAGQTYHDMAAKALQGLLSNPALGSDLQDIRRKAPLITATAHALAAEMMKPRGGQ